MKIAFKKITNDAKVPTQAYAVDAGWDLYANDSAVITSGSISAITTGISLDIPQGYFGEIKERSGYSLKNTLSIKGGVIDSHYQGEIKVIFFNGGAAPVKVAKGDKIAQIVIQKIPTITFTEVDNFEESKRGTKGFGSSDTNTNT